MHPSRLARLAFPVMLAFLVALAGCASMVHVRIGDPVDLKPFAASLRVGESTREDVLAALGVPAGRGRAMLPIDKEPRTVWFYWYADASVVIGESKGKMDAVIVFVYFKGDRYDGSMYGSALKK